MQILPDLYLFGGKDYHLTYTDWDSRDCNVYVVDTKDGLVLIDTGCGETLPEILKRFTIWGLAPEEITHVFLTHEHINHAGAALALRRMRAKVVATKPAVDALTAGDERIGWFRFHVNPVYCDEIDAVEDREMISIGDCDFTFVATPGHSAGSQVILLERKKERVLFSGDTILPGTLGWRGAVDYDARQHLESAKKLFDYPSDVLLPGHGCVCMSRTHILVEETFRQIVIEKNRAESFK